MNSKNRNKTDRHNNVGDKKYIFIGGHIKFIHIEIAENNYLYN